MNQTQNQKLPITVIILTYNEAVNIADCIGSVSEFEDVVVVDSGSTDNTLDLARAARSNARTYSHPFSNFGDQRNWALDNTEPLDWVLFMDADERMTPPAQEEMTSAVSCGTAGGFYICLKYMFMGHWIRHCTLFPSWQLRLLQLGAVRFRSEGHGQREITKEPLGYIREGLYHYGLSKGPTEWIERHNRYSTAEAKLLTRLRSERIDWGGVFRGTPVERRRAFKQLSARLPGRPIVRMIYTYFLRGGFLDGRAGWAFCCLRYAHELNIYAKMKYERHEQTREGH